MRRPGAVFRFAMTETRVASMRAETGLVVLALLASGCNGVASSPSAIADPLRQVCPSRARSFVVSIDIVTST